MATLFIADLHLQQQEPAITAGFLHFLQREAIHADALYILGDLFEYWIGDDDPQPLSQQIAASLRQLQQQGVPCYFVRGNRDFLLGQAYAKQCGMTLLPQENVITLYNQRILFLHGDTLCTDDQAYQRYRKKMHNPIIQWLFLRLPLALRLKIAAYLRQRSQISNNSKDEYIMDVNQDAVIDALQRHQVSCMIHGHTHRPAIHTFTLPNGQTAQRAVLGVWHSKGSMIRVDENGIELIEFPF